MLHASRTCGKLLWTGIVSRDKKSVGASTYLKAYLDGACIASAQDEARENAESHQPREVKILQTQMVSTRKESRAAKPKY